MEITAFYKSAGSAVFGKGVEVTPDMLAKINGYSRTPLTAEQVYVGKFVVAHSGIDRDNERFTPAILMDFARTLPGKGYFNNEGGHPGSWSGQRGPGQGLWFDSNVMQMSLDEFQAMTGERPQLPPGETMISAMIGHMYALRTPGNEDMIANMDGGIHRHVSIGFNAPMPVAVKNPGDNLNTLFYEYQGPGEALETSGVWLGAQPGAVAVKAARSNTHDDDNPHKGAKNMEFKELYEKEKALREDTEKKHVDLVAKNLATETELKDLKAEIGDTTVSELKALAADGKAYRAAQVKEYIRLARLDGSLPDDPEALAAKQAVIEGFPMDFLADEIKTIRARVAKTHPGQAELPAEDAQERREAGGKEAPAGEKDYADPRFNEFIFGAAGK